MVINSDQFIEAIKRQLQPPSRVQHMVDMLQQLFACTPDDATLADLVVGWQIVARPQSQNEEPSVVHRRQICAQLSVIAAQCTGEPGNLAGTVRIWQAWQTAFQTSADPRQAAMAKIFARELVELQDSQGK